MAKSEKLASSGRRRGDSLAESYPVSIIIPAHNAQAHLSRCLEGLEANDLSCCEVLLIDDASEDETPSTAGAFLQRLPLKIESLTRRQGPSTARNRGVELARHPILFFLDSDVVVPPRTLHWIRETLDLYSHREDVIGVLGSYTERTESGDFWSEYKNLVTCFLYDVTDTQSPFLHTPIFAVEKEALLRAGGFDPAVQKGEDFKLGLLFGSQGYRFVIDRRIRGLHLKRYSASGILREDWERIQSLGSLKLNRREKRFSWRAHRWNRLLSMPIPFLMAASLFLGAVLASPWLWAVPLLALLFVLLNFRLAAYFRRRKGWRFAAGAVVVLFFEMLWAELALLSGVFKRA